MPTFPDLVIFWPPGQKKKKNRGGLSSTSFVVPAVPEGQRGKLEKIPVNTSLIAFRTSWSNQAVKQRLLQTGPARPHICAGIWRIQTQWRYHSSSLEPWFNEEMDFTPNPNGEQLGAKLSSPNNKGKCQLYNLRTISNLNDILYSKHKSSTNFVIKCGNHNSPKQSI